MSKFLVNSEVAFESEACFVLHLLHRPPDYVVYFPCPHIWRLFPLTVSHIICKNYFAHIHYVPSTDVKSSTILVENWG